MLALCGGLLFQKEGLAGVKTIPVELPLVQSAGGKLFFLIAK